MGVPLNHPVFKKGFSPKKPTILWYLHLLFAFRKNGGRQWLEAFRKNIESIQLRRLCPTEDTRVCTQRMDPIRTQSVHFPESLKCKLDFPSFPMTDPVVWYRLIRTQNWGFDWWWPGGHGKPYMAYIHGSVMGFQNCPAIQWNFLPSLWTAWPRIAPRHVRIGSEVGGCRGRRSWSATGCSKDEHPQMYFFVWKVYLYVIFYWNLRKKRTRMSRNTWNICKPSGSHQTNW